MTDDERGMMTESSSYSTQIENYIQQDTWLLTLFVLVIKWEVKVIAVVEAICEQDLALEVENGYARAVKLDSGLVPLGSELVVH